MVQLVRLERAIEESIGNHPAYMEALAQDDWARVADLVHGLVGRTLVSDPVSVNELRWGGYLVVDEATREVVGSCAFKSAPTEEGTVEIALYLPGLRGAWVHNRDGGETIELASSSPAVRRVVAHTLPETNASTRVLERVRDDVGGRRDRPRRRACVALADADRRQR